MITTEQTNTELAMGTKVLDVCTGETLVVVEDRGPRVLVAGLKSLEPTATLIERAQRVLPRAELAVL